MGLLVWTMGQAIAGDLQSSSRRSAQRNPALQGKIFRSFPARCTKTKVRQFLKPGAMPVYKLKRPVQFTSVEKVDAKLDRLQQLGIISPVDFSL